MWGALDYHSDSWAWYGANSDCRYEFGCVGEGTDPVRMEDGEPLTNNPISGRQSLARFRLGGSLEFILSNHWNMWVSFEGAFGNPRRILGDVLAGGAGRDDIQVYTRLGFTYKFGYQED